MRLLKPSWVSHDGHPIFSLDIHPDGSRFATGGQGEDSGRVVVWNMAPVLDEEDEKDENVPKMLCQMDNHLACVNCVRWSNSGKYLASGGDDKVIMIWQTGRYSGNQGCFGGGGAKVNVELWKCVSTLRGHSGDVLDLAWSPRDAWLASCSVDNSVIIWNAQKMPEMLTVLRGHSGLVKGVSWDPVGKYLASQSDDKTLRIWRTSDWHQEKVIAEPFRECGGTTHVLRLSWSPDGHYLVSAHAMNNSGPTAQIVERDGWKTVKDFVGHRKAITCVRFNPNILSKVVKVAGKVQHYCCCAIGSRDRSLSIWLTALKRPLVVVHDIFSNSILDVSWSHKGDQIMACSWDGTVASLGFEEEEIGKPLSDEQKDSFYQKMYGKSFRSNNIANSYNTIIENPELLKLKESQEKEQKKVKESDQQTDKVVIQAKGPLNRQIETITADGRRRITPMFIAPAPDLGRDIPPPFNSRPQPTFSSSTERQSKILIEKRDETPTTPTVTSNPALTTVITTTTSGNSDVPHVTITAIPTSIASVAGESPQCMGVTKPMLNGITSTNDVVKIIQIPQQTMSSVTISVPGTSTMSAVDILKVGDVKKDKPKEVFKPSVKVIDVRKELAKPQMKRGPGRPPLSEKMTHQLIHQTVQDREVHPQSRPSSLHPSSDLHLPPLRADRSHSVQVSFGKGEPSMLLELENSVSVTSCIVVHKMKCTRSDKSWEVLLPAKGCAAAGSKHLVCAVCEDGSLSIYSMHGRRLQPSLILTSMASRLTCNGYHIMVITSRGYVTVWDLKSRSVLVKNESLLPIMSGAANDLTISSTSLTDHGCPVVSLSVGKSYMFSPEMGSWILIHNAEDIMQQCSDHHSCLPSQPSLNGTSLPLAALQSQFRRPSQQTQRLFRSNPSIQQASTLCHIDNQLTAAMSLNSSKEFKFWLLTLTRYLVQEGLEERLRELCDNLLGAISLFRSKDSDGNDWYIQGLHKRDLLQEILPIIGSNLQLQRLFAEYQELLDVSKM